MEAGKKKQFDEWNQDLRARGQKELKWEDLYDVPTNETNQPKESRA